MCMYLHTSLWEKNHKVFILILRKGKYTTLHIIVLFVASLVLLKTRIHTAIQIYPYTHTKLLVQVSIQQCVGDDDRVKNKTKSIVKTKNK